eukprot:Phypoly_transcript_09990.p1 GENE.Phypoly_transcript_09990~~Phypoly_transcript_09990.p1  ORF type:complete len:134 (+),score=23.01 Phypoly_transcript_09990:90-491(+)
MEDSNLSALVGRLKDDLNGGEEQADLGDSTGSTSAHDPGPTSQDLGPTSVIGSVNPPSADDEDQQPLLLKEEENGGSMRGSRRLGDVELRIPLRLQKMKAAAISRKHVIHRPYFTIFVFFFFFLFFVFFLPLT